MKKTFKSNDENLNEKLLVEETLFSTANGYIGLRANFEEGYASGFDTIRGTYINGFYDVIDITYGESAYGFPTTAQKIVNVIDGQGIRLAFDEEEFSFFDGEIVGVDRKLDIYNGKAIRKVHWRSPSGIEVIIKFSRMTSFTKLELCIIHIEVESINFDGKIKITSFLDGNVTNYTNQNDPRVASSHASLLNVVSELQHKDTIQMTSTTKRSNIKVSATACHSRKMETSYHKNVFESFCYAPIEAGKSIEFTKYLVYTDSIRHENCSQEGLKIIKAASKHLAEYWFKNQINYLNDFWRFSMITVEDHPDIEEALNYSVYQLLASAGKEPHSNISAKGLSGEGYEGHYFWDTEVYMLPFFTLTNPLIARNLLRFRYETLNYSRERALQMGHQRGAKIPWRTISGTECSGYFPAGSAQYHINADVAYSNIQYFLISNDIQYMLDYGLEVLVETARIWLDMGHFTDNNRFMIQAVTGPDEYTAIVNNNYYTNSMAKYHLEWTVNLCHQLKKTHTKEYVKIQHKINITTSELHDMAIAANRMVLPYDEKLDIFLQDDSFKDKPTWNFERTPKDKYPLLLHYHPLTIYRHKVLKQADTMLSMILLDNVKESTYLNSYNYYEPLTTHDSSLSPCVHSIAASRIRNSKVAYDFFMKTLRLDLDNLHHNTKDGLHIANAGGAYMTVIYGFAGLRIKEGGLYFYPCLPDEMKSIIFGINYQGSLVKIQLGKSFKITVEKEMDIYIFDKHYTVVNHLEVQIYE